MSLISQLDAAVPSLLNRFDFKYVHTTMSKMDESSSVPPISQLRVSCLEIMLAAIDKWHLAAERNGPDTTYWRAIQTGWGQFVATVHGNNGSPTMRLAFELEQAVAYTSTQVLDIDLDMTS